MSSRIVIINFVQIKLMIVLLCFIIKKIFLFDQYNSGMRNGFIQAVTKPVPLLLSLCAAES